MSESEPLMNHRKVYDDVKTKFCLVAWDKINGNLFIGWSASGVEVA